MQTTDVLCSHTCIYAMEDKKYTIKDIARLAGVSAGTVDRVLHQRGDVSEKSYERVKRVLEEIDYSPNRFAIGLAAKKSYRIACVVPEGCEGDYWSSVGEGIARAAKEMRDFNVQVQGYSFRHADEQSYRMACQAVQEDEETDAVLIAPNFKEPTLQLTEILDGRDIPYTFIDFNIEEAHALCYIGQDSFRSGYLAAKTLMQHHREGDELVLFLSGKKESPAEIQMQRRLEGFTTYLAEHHNRLMLHDVILDKVDEEKNRAILDEFFQTHPQATLGAAFNSRVYLVGHYLKDSRHQLRGLVGYDLLPQSVECLQQGTVDYLIGQRPRLQGYFGIQTLCNHVVFKQKVTPLRYMPIDLLIKENIDYYFEQ